MKTKLIVLVGVICLAVAAQATEKRMLKGQTFTTMGDYEVFKDLDKSNDNIKIFVIKYENTDESFVVRVCEGDKCHNYVVYGKNLELQYKSKKNNVFGLTKMDKEFRNLDKGVVAERVDREQMFRQKVISTTPKSEKEYLGLIACYLPQLVK
jgi:ABC-type thiamine transport system substrate-binding protein